MYEFALFPIGLIEGIRISYNYDIYSIFHARQKMQDESEPENVDSFAQNVGVETPVELITTTNGSVVDDAQNNVSNVQIAWS